MNPFLSIVIPTLNEEIFLPLLLRDLAQQTSKDFEVIVVDGNSEDKTIQKAQEFKKEITLHIEKVTRRNLSHQRNTGAGLSKGEYILILDADTRLQPEFVAVLNQEIQKERAMIYLPTILPVSTKLLYKIMFNISNFLVVLSQNWKRPFPTIAAMIFNRDFFISLGGYTVTNAQDEKKFFPEDHDIIHRAKKAGVKAKVLRSVQVKVSQRRMEQKSELKTFTTYALSTVYMTLFGKMNNSTIEYEMGGHVYDHK